jgi:hypothetical protein
MVTVFAAHAVQVQQCGMWPPPCMHDRGAMKHRPARDVTGFQYTSHPSSNPYTLLWIAAMISTGSTAASPTTALDDGAWRRPRSQGSALPRF